MAKDLQPLVSVIITCYNKKKYIKRAIDSALMQKVGFEYEIIIVDDASTDGSYEILEKIAGKYPEQIRLYRNKTNQGITKTWIKICKKVKGQWIARLDGDDYWIDEKKLQKQIDLLAKHPESKWCNTDFDMTDETGEIRFKKCFSAKIIPLPKSYEDMLVSRGFTMASTWVVDARLMGAINDELDFKTKDDTFNIQLELFQRTQLTFLPTVTTVYNCLSDSDSHPSIEQYRKRCENLSKTQIDFLKKYPKADFEKMLELSFLHYNEWDIRFYAQNPSYEQLLAERDQAVAERDLALRENRRLLRVERELNRVIEDIHNSTSWKLTKPIRSIKKLSKS